MKETAVEWLMDKLQQNKFITESQIHLAKEMEKQQLNECWKKAQDEQRKEFSSNYCSIQFEKYYNETFNK